MSKETKDVAVVQRDITTKVLEKVNAFKESGELRIPDNYSPENAIKSAYLILSETRNAAGKAPLQICTPASIASALLKMVVWGLSPMKKQCDFIMYGDKLECGIEYTGNIALAKRWGGMKDVKASAVFEGDEFEFETDIETGRKRIIKHVQSLEAMGLQKVIGAYAVVEMEDETYFTEIMAMSQIKAAWNQGAMKGNSPAHKNFPDQMAIKTVISRACKLLIRGSDDSILYNVQDKESDSPIDKQVTHEINQEANKEVIDIEEVETETEIDQETGEVTEKVKKEPNF